MKVEINTLPEFDKRFKRLAKKYKSIADDLESLMDSLEKDPMYGTPLGFGGAHKIRMAILSKGAGKSGGARVISFTLTVKEPDEYLVTLLTIYDKSEMENVADNYIKDLVSQVAKA